MPARLPALERRDARRRRHGCRRAAGRPGRGRRGAIPARVLGAPPAGGGRRRASSTSGAPASGSPPQPSHPPPSRRPRDLDGSPSVNPAGGCGRRRRAGRVRGRPGRSQDWGLPSPSIYVYFVRILVSVAGATMCRCRTRRSTSPMETSPSTSAPRSSPATTSRPRSPLRFVGTSTSRREGEKGSTRSSFGSGSGEWPQGPLRRPAPRRVGQLVAGSGREPTGSTAAAPAGTFSMSSAVGRVHDGRRRRASRPAGADTLGWATSATGRTPAESTLEVVDTLEALRAKVPPQLYDMVAGSTDRAGDRGPRHLTCARAVGRGGDA